jgi:hypothetical protein
MPREEFKNRYLSAYFSTEKEKVFWENFAEERGTTLSKLVLEGLAMLRDRDLTKPRPDLIKENDELKAELKKINYELKIRNELLRKYETEVYKARHSGFKALNIRDDESRRYDLDLVKLLKSGKTFNSEELLGSLNIDSEDIEASGLVWNQLSALEAFGLVVETRFGWKWSA